MSRLYGRVEDVRSISEYLKDKYDGVYTPDKTIIEGQELENAPSVIAPYLSSDSITYLDSLDIELAYNRLIRETCYSGPGEKSNIIYFPTKNMKEEYKRELIFFMGDLLRRKNFDRYPDVFDIKCQYSNVLPLLIEYLYLRDTGKEDRFSPKYLQDLKISALEFLKRYRKNINRPEKEEQLLNDTLLILIALSSMDATLQIKDKFASDKDSLIQLIDELVVNERHDREEIIKRRDIDTFGFKTLRKEIDRYKGVKHE